MDIKELQAARTKALVKWITARDEDESNEAEVAFWWLDAMIEARLAKG